MTFSSLTFLFVFFPVTFLLYALIRNHTARNFILAAASLVFYAFGEPVAVMIMLISIVLNYLFGRGAAGTKWDKPAVVLAVVLNIGLLFAYKYTGFFTEILNAVFRLSIPVPQIRLPIGISFFTFQGLSYVIDVYRDKKNVQKNLFSVLLYISFFPQLIAGPIVRYSDIAAQIQEREFSFDRISRGVFQLRPDQPGRVPFPLRSGEEGPAGEPDGPAGRQGLLLRLRPARHGYGLDRRGLLYAPDLL